MAFFLKKKPSGIFLETPRKLGNRYNPGAWSCGHALLHFFDFSGRLVHPWRVDVSA
jgi:hypothetical protein